MAKVTGPLMSMDASGTVGNTATFSKWKGRNYVRLRVIPMNPNSVGQQTVRSVMGTIAKAANAVLTIAKDSAVPAVGSAFFAAAVAAAAAGQSWISSMQKTLNSQFAALVIAFAALAGGVDGFYETEAIGLGMSSYTDKAGVTHTPGEQLYVLASYAVTKLGYTGFAAGIDAATELQLTAFGTYVHTTVV